MSQQNILGKVALTPRGAYSPSTTYNRLDVVTYSGSSYIVLQSVGGITPPNEAYYQLIASKGDAGTDGVNPTVTAGTATMLPVGSAPTVTNSGTAQTAIFNFGIPYPSLADSEVTTAKLADGAVTAVKLGESATDIVADTFSASAAYSTGDYCIYSGVLYRFTADKTAGAWDSAKVVAVALADDVSNVKSDFNEKVNSRYTTVEPENWLDLDAITDGEIYKNGTVVESTSRFYTDYIPIDKNSVIQCFRGDTLIPIYRRHITGYDANKNILPSFGSDSSSIGTYTVALTDDRDLVKYVRITLDKNVLTLKPMITLNGVPTKYSAYFAPYDEITSDFLTAESEAALQGVKDETAAYGYAMPIGTDIRLTVGIAEKWYYKSMLTPNSLSTSIGLGTQYSQRENDGLNIPNTDALNSSNGYTFTVYNENLKPVFVYNPNSGYGLPRKIVAENLQNCSALVIGDSTVDFDTMTQKMIDYFASKSKTLTLLGTLGSGNNKNEGRAGWKAQDYLTNRQYDGVVNPFYNPTSETFDFSYYMTNQGYSAPNFVIIQLGINDLYNSRIDAIEPTWAAIKTMIDSIIAYNSTIKILLNLPTTPNSDQNKHDVFLPLYQNRVVRYNQYAQAQALSYGASKVRCTYCHLILDPATDIRDNVHPTNAGFEKMAKEVISQINVWQNGQ